jgi:hypothetical protein
VRQHLTKGEFPWLPQLYAFGNDTSGVITSVFYDGVYTFQATQRFGPFSINFFDPYDINKYQVFTDVAGFESGLAANRSADLVDNPWRTNDTDYTPDYTISKSESFARWQTAFTGVQRNFGVPKELICARDNRTSNTLFKNYNNANTTDLIQRFCDERIRQVLVDNTQIYVPVTGSYRTTSVNLTFEWPNSGPIAMVFVVGADPGSFLYDRPLETFFDGTTLDARISSCKQIYQDLLWSVILPC